MTNPIKIIIENGKATAMSPFPSSFLLIVAGLSGRKIWNGSKSVTFEAMKINIKRIEESGLQFDYEDKGNTIEGIHNGIEIISKKFHSFPLADNNFSFIFVQPFNRPCRLE